ncbi:MAG: FemAB family XrtA/PEP-CTERM system-associated protein [Vicinamibacterales bacterium]
MSASHGAVVVTMAGEADEEEWARFVDGQPDATGYHSWGWRRVFARAFGHESFYLLAKESGRVVGVLPLVFVKSALFGRSLTSMAFVNYGGVLTDSPDAAHQLVAEARHLAERLECPHVELRHLGRRFPELPCREHKVTMLLPLKSGMWEALDRKVRNQVRKAQKSELSAERGGAELLEDFYAVFARNMRDLGTPVYSRALFHQVLQEFPSRAAIHVVRRGVQPIAAALTFETGGRVEVPWASSIRDFNALCPNHLLYWHIIETAVERGCQLMDFGRSTPNEGTFKFKEQWGAQAVPLHWEYVLVKGGELPMIAAGNPKYRLMVEAWKRLPLSIASWIGPGIVSGIP